MLLLLFPSFAQPQGGESQATREGDLVKLADNVYARIVSPDGNAVGNSGVVVLDHSVLVFDTHFTPEGAQALLTKIRALTSKPVRYVVNSHFHPDHTHGNQVFGSAHIISSFNARRDILQKDLPTLNRTLTTAQSQLDRLRKELASPAAGTVGNEQLRGQIASRQELLDRMSRLKIIAPVLTLDDRLLIREEAREVELRFVGAGHTDGDIIMFLPAEKILFLGDLFFNAALPNTQDANLLEWMKTLEQILKIDAVKFVPGHGAAGTAKDVKEFMGYLEELKALVQPAVTRGDSMEQILRDVQVPARFSSYRFQNFFQANVQEMYVELRALQLASQPAPPPEGARKKVPENPAP